MKPGGIAQHKSNCKCCICKAKRGENRGENNPCYKEKIVKKGSNETPRSSF